MYTLLKRTVSVFVIASLVFAPVRVYAADVEMPDVGSAAGIVAGTGNLGATVPNPNGTATRDITQTSDRMIVEWEKFSIGTGGTVTFNQPGQSSIALNKVTSGNPSNIYGALNANGRIFLVNPNGILFGPDSAVNVGGLLASTLAYTGTNDQFMSGTNTFAFAKGVESSAGAILNQGDLNVFLAPGGFVALLAPSIENSGNIVVASEMNTITLASGNAVTLALDPQNLISVAVGDPGEAAAGVVNSGSLHAPNGKVLINAQVVNTALKNSVNNSGIIEANDIVITGNGDIELQSGSSVRANNDSGVASVKIETTGGNIDIAASEVLSQIENGVASVKVESKTGNINVANSEVAAQIGGDGPGDGNASVDILAGGNGSEINIEKSSISAGVTGQGQSRITIASGDYELELPLDPVLGDDLVDQVEHLSGFGSINVTDSDISGIVAGNVGVNSSVEIGLKAQYIDIENSFITAMNEGKGWALVDIFAGSYDYVSAWQKYDNMSFDGGILTISGSGILASTGDGTGSDVRDTHVSAQGQYVVIDSSALAAQVKNSGDAYAEVIAGSYDDIEDPGVESEISGPYYNFLAGELSIIDNLEGEEDNPLIIDSIPSVSALVGKDGTAEVSIEGGLVSLENASLHAQVKGNGSTQVGLYAGDIEETGVDREDLSEYGEGESFDVNFGGGSLGVIDLVNSSILSRVDGVGDANVEAYASGDFNGEYPEGGLKVLASAYPTDGINADNSIILAEVVGDGSTSASVVLQAGNYTQHKTSAQSNERLDGGRIELLNDTLVVAKGSNMNDTAKVELMAGNITVDNSAVQASVTGNGSAMAYLRAGDWVNYYSTSGEVEYGYKTLMSGSLNVLNNGQISSRVGQGGGAFVEMDAVDITLDLAQVIAEVGANGGAAINMWGGLTYWYLDGSIMNREGSIDILNQSQVTASASQAGFASANFYVHTIDVKDSTIKATATASSSAGAYIGFFPDNDGDSYFDSRQVTIDNSDVTAEVLGTYGYAFIQVGYEPGETEGFNDVLVDIINGSTVTASVPKGIAGVEMDVAADINIENSTVQALATQQGNAHIDINMIGEGNDLTVSGSSLVARVAGEGHANINVYNSEYNDYFWYLADEYFGGLFNDLLVDKDMSGPVLGSINITNSTLLAEANTSSPYDWSTLFNTPTTGVIGMMSTGAITLTNSTLSAKEINHPAAIGLLSGESVSVDSTSHVSATTSGADSIAVVGLLSMGSINIAGAVNADAGDGVAGVGVFGFGDVNAAGTVKATGKGDGMGLITKLLLNYQDSYSSFSLGLPGNLSSAVLMGSYYGDVTLGQIAGDLVGVAAFGQGEGDASILGTATGLVSGKLLAVLARNNIGTAAQPINTDVDVAAGFSYGEGDIYLNEANNIELGLMIPVSVSGVNWNDIRSLVSSSEGGTMDFGMGISLAARNGIVHVESQGDIVVNSILTPMGGVYLKSFNGSIYAGNGWDPSYYCEDGCYPEEDIASLLSDMGINVSKELFSVIDRGMELMLMNSPFATEGDQGSWFFLPFAVGFDNESGSFLNDGPNVIASGYSYFSTPNGTIGVGSPSDKDPNISGQILGVVRPGSTAVTGLNPSVDLDLSQGVPPGLVYYDDNSSYSGNPMDGSSTANVGPKQVWPESPVVSPVLPNVNPLRVHIEVLPDSKSAIPAGFTPLLSGLTLQIGNSSAPRPPVNNGVSQLANPLFRSYRAYYEILNSFRLVSIEPMTPTTFFAYHPLTEADSGAFDGIELDPEAYEYIDGNLNYNGDVGTYLEESKNN